MWVRPKAISRFQPVMLNSALAMSRGHCPRGTASGSLLNPAMANSPTAPAAMHSERKVKGGNSRNTVFMIGQLNPHTKVIRAINNKLPRGMELT